MKFSKVFGIVLFLHLGVIAVFILQPGCRTTQPPTRVGTVDDFRGGQTGQTFISERADIAPPTVIVDDEEFAASGRSAPRRPAADEEMAFDDDFGLNGGFGDDFAAAFNPSAMGDEPMSVPVSGRGETIHSVQRGDSLWAISRQYNVSLNELLALNNLSRDAVLRVGQEIRVPTEGSTATVSIPQADAFQPSALEASSTTYTVERGDTLSRIASRNNTTVAAIMAANNKSSDVIRVGEQLIIPGGGASAAAPTRTPAPATGASRPAAQAPSQEGIHVVQSGEIPGTIARQYGMTAAELLELNGISDPRRLQVGQRLRVRTTGSATGATAATAPRATAPAPQEARATETVRTPAPTPTRPTTPTPVTIRTVEADPLPEGAFPEDDLDDDELFRDAVEIPVIRVERD